MFWMLAELGLGNEALLSIFIGIFVLLVSGAWLVTIRSPMAYDIYIVEIHNWTSRRVVQVIQIGQSFNPANGWDALMRRLRSRVTALHADTEATAAAAAASSTAHAQQTQAVTQDTTSSITQSSTSSSSGTTTQQQSSNVNIVVRSPMTVINEDSGAFETRDSEPLRVLEVEMPVAEDVPLTDSMRDSHYATAAAIAILSSSNLDYMQSQSLSDSGRSTDDALDHVATLTHNSTSHLTNSRPSSVTLPSIVNVNVVEMHQTTPTRLNSSEEADVSRSTRDTPPNSLATSADNSDSESEERQFRRRHPRIPRAERMLNQTAAPSSRRPLTTTTPTGEEQSSTSALVNEDVLYERLSEVSVEVEQGLEAVDEDATPTGDTPPSGERICVRLKFLDDTQRDVAAHTGESLEQFKKKNFPEDVANGKVIRLIYQGQLLRDESRSLESYGVKEMSVIHVHISNVPYKAENSTRLRAGPQLTDPTQPNMASTRGMQPQQQGDFDPANSPLYVIWAAIFHSLSPFFFRGIFRGLPRSLPWRTGGFFARHYQRLYNAIFNAYNPYGTDGADSLDAAADAAARPLPQEFNMSDYMIYILSAHIIAVWSFVLMFPNYCDRTAFFLLSVLTAYFVFIISQTLNMERIRNMARSLLEWERRG